MKAKRKVKNHFPKAFLMAGHKKRAPKKSEPDERVEAASLAHRVRLRSTSPTVAPPQPKADLSVFSPLPRDAEGSRLVPLDGQEVDAINTMIDFFRASGEQEHLDPKVYEAIAEKLGNGRPKSVVKTFLLYDTTIAKEGETGELVGVFSALTDAIAEADTAVGFVAGDKSKANGFQHCIEEWHGSQLIRHHFRDAFDAWTSEGA